MHRLPVTIAAIAFEPWRQPHVVIARRHLDGRLNFTSDQAPDRGEPLLRDRLDLPHDALLFVHRLPMGVRADPDWHPLGERQRPVDLMINGPLDSLADSIGGGRRIAQSPGPAAASALILAIGLARIAETLKLSYFADRAIADLGDWLPPAIAEPPPPRRPRSWSAPPLRTPPTAFALAFGRALNTQKD